MRGSDGSGLWPPRPGWQVLGITASECESNILFGRSPRCVDEGRKRASIGFPSRLEPSMRSGMCSMLHDWQTLSEIIDFGKAVFTVSDLAVWAAHRIF